MYNFSEKKHLNESIAPAEWFMEKMLSAEIYKQVVIQAEKHQIVVDTQTMDRKIMKLLKGKTK